MKSFSPRPRTHGIDPSRPPTERYRILGRIAAGGMAEIYLGRMATRSGGWREVALKRLMPDLQADKEFVQMFYDEARIASQLNHPNIVQIYELGELDGSMFIAMELIRGINLRELYERSNAEGKPIPLPLALKIACGALEALGYAHSFVDEQGTHLNIVHRDVSPQNILVTYQGEVKLVDFGVAKAENRVHQTRQGLIKGKFAYMAPEQITGEKVDGRSDLFALAEVLYQLMLRRHPFYAESDAAVLQAVIESRATPPHTLDPKFPPPLAAILMVAMQRKPESRYPHAAAMREAIETYMLDRARAPTQETLGRFVRDLFQDRLQLEEQARNEDDDDLLVEAMRVSAKSRAILREAKKVERASQKRRGRGAVRFDPATEREGPAAVTPVEVFQIPDEDPDPNMRTVSVGGAPRSKDSSVMITAENRGQDTAGLRVYDEPEIDPALQRKPAAAEHDQATAEATVIHPEAVPTPVAVRREPSEMKRPRKKSRAGAVPPSASVAGLKIGRYAVIDRAGHDEISELFLARQIGVQGFEKRVLVKQILPDLSQEIGFVEAFLREVKLASNLSHPNIVSMLDLGFEGEQFHLVTEYVPGFDLARVLDECRVRGEVLPVPIACKIAAGVMAALAAAHGAHDEHGAPQPILHRDVRPERIWITHQGGVKVADFGIANATSSSMLTSSDEVRGKPEYMAPEQLSREYGVPDARCDVYSAGLVLYEMLTLECPFRRTTTFETIMAVLRDPVRAIGSLRVDIPKVLEMIVEQAVARKPAERHPSAAALLHDVERFSTRNGETVIEPEIGQFVRKLMHLEDPLTDSLLLSELGDSEDFTTAHPAPLGSLKA